jgi:hypothetical protein
MIYKFSVSVSGDNFYPENVLKNILGDFVVESYFNPSDSKPINISEDYGYGIISFTHPKKYSTENEIIKYEKDFLEFIEKNYYSFVENGVDDIEIFLEVYFDGGQCNFEIFNKEALKKISSMGVSLPISIYLLSEDEIEKWENEISPEWES